MKEHFLRSGEAAKEQFFGSGEAVKEHFGGRGGCEKAFFWGGETYCVLVFFEKRSAYFVF